MAKENTLGERHQVPLTLEEIRLIRALMESHAGVRGEWDFFRGALARFRDLELRLSFAREEGGDGG